MPKRCGCASDICACQITPGAGIEISGTGSATNPYVVTAIPDVSSLTVQDEGTTLISGVTQIDFVGDGVFASPSGSGAVTVTVPGTTATGDMSGIAVQVNTYTADATWTKPPNLLYAVVEVQGGGGGSGGTTTTAAGQVSHGGGGGGGGYARKMYSASALGGTEPVVVGTGGGAGPASTSAGGTGGNSTFKSLIGGGGSGGFGGGAATNNTAQGGAGGVSSGGDVNVNGGTGLHGMVINNAIVSLSKGGDSFFGTGGRQAVLGSGLPGTQGGGGSGPTIGASTTGTIGATGGTGIVVITSYIKV